MKIKLFSPTLILVLSLLLFLSFGYYSYNYNNKYKNNSVQPISGVLFLTEKDLATNNPIFLAHQWTYFQDQLLTPADFENGTAKSGSFITLGSYANFSSGDTKKQPHGSATYRLSISLPEAPATYALYLPEIFSSYILYINEKEVLRMGNPNPDTYHDEVGNELVTFTASGKIHLTIAVTDYSHIYSGIVYPPAFGNAPTVEHYISTRLLLSGILLTIICLFALLSLYFFWKLKHKNAGLFALLCIMLFISSLYPILFSYGTYPIHPWYTIELVCLTGMYPLITLLQNRILNAPKKTARIETTLFCTFFIFAIVFSLFLNGSSLYGKLYSSLIFTFKATCSLLLLIHAYQAYYKSMSTTPVLLIGTVFFACSLITDRLYPDYEPVYGGWFQETGAFLLVLAIGYELWKDLTEAYRTKLLLQEETNQLSKQIGIQKTHYAELTNRIDESIRLRHDHRHHLQTIFSYLKQNKIEKAICYLNEYIDTREQNERIVLCRNMLVDALLHYYKSKCQEHNIAFECLAELPVNLSISDTDFSILLGNLLENAFEAASLVNSTDSFMKVQIQWQKGKIIASIQNSFEKEPIIKNGHFYSTKHSGTGIGTASAKIMTEKYHGVIAFDSQNNHFCVTFIIPIKCISDKN